MGKYEALQRGVFSIFGSPEWLAENIKTFPANFIEVNPGKEFLRVSVLPKGKGLNLLSAAGVLIIEIYTSVGNGPLRSTLIADKLDKYLSGKSIPTSEGNTQLGISAFSPEGIDKADASLYRSLYTIPFNYFGVQQ